MKNPFSLEGKTILVTGASSGIGRSTAIECSKMGAKLIITGRNQDRLIETFLMLEGDGHQYIQADLSLQSDIDKLVNYCPEIAGCVHCAGIIKLLSLKSIKRETIDNILNINTISSILLTSALIKLKKIVNKSSIVFISSLSGVFITNTGESLYSTSKGALSGFAKGAAYELANRQIRVNSINAWAIDTQSVNCMNNNTIFSEILDYSNMGNGDDSAMSKLIERSPMKRLGTPVDIANSVIFLLSDASSWITGINLVIDGGYTLS